LFKVALGTFRRLRQRGFGQKLRAEILNLKTTKGPIYLSAGGDCKSALATLEKF